jgi:diguanylate cyclase (GGDEF)-like protein
MMDVSAARIARLGNLAAVLSRSLPVPQILETAAEVARDVIGAASVSISQLEPGTATLRTILNVGDLGPEETRWPDDELYSIRDFDIYGMVEDGLKTATHHVADPDCDPHHRTLLQQLGKGSSLLAPIVVDGRAWGEFYTTRHLGRPPSTDAVDISCLEVLVAILSGALSRATREESLTQLAFRDPLTGLVNRRGLDEQVAKAFNVPEGVTRHITVVVVDINGLKSVNDSLGHLFGDQLIQAVSRALNATFDRFPGSLVARVGGDEFVVLISGLDPYSVIQAADELCSRTWNIGSGATISAGLATVGLSHDHTLTPASLFAAADQAQYSAKRSHLSYTMVSDRYPPEMSSTPTGDR